MTMVVPFRLAGLNVRFYEVDEQLLPCMNTLADVQWSEIVVGVHYFGRPYDLTPVAAFCRERRCVLIEDAAHVDISSLSPTSVVGSVGEFTLSCPRKLYRIYDGAALVGSAADLRLIKQTRPSVREQLKSVDAIVRNVQPRGVVSVPPTETKVVEGYVDPRFEITSRSRATLASRLTWHLLSRRRRAKDVRVRHYEAIHRVVRVAAGIRPLFVDMPVNVMPYVYPAVLDKPEDFRRLRRLGINVLRWEELATKPSDRVERFMWSLIQLPCCDAMSDNDFARMLGYLGELG